MKIAAIVAQGLSFKGPAPVVYVSGEEVGLIMLFMLSLVCMLMLTWCYFIMQYNFFFCIIII